jgi:hypothetical protein
MFSRRLNEREHSPAASPAVLTFSPVPAARIGSFREFWPYYLSQHRKRLPATFQYPLWSLAADWKMWALRLTGRLDAELRRHEIEP